MPGEAPDSGRPGGGRYCVVKPPWFRIELSTPAIGAGSSKMPSPAGPLVGHPNPRRDPVPRVRQEVPRHISGLAMRTRRARPSERLPQSRHVGLFPHKARHLGLATPRRGGLRTPANEYPRSTDRPSPLGNRAFVQPSFVITCPGIRPARICGRAERAPPP